MLNLADNPTLQDFQKYVTQLKQERGFSGNDPVAESLLLGEEVGELFKAVRKSEGWTVDPQSKIGSVAEELADCLVYLCSIANVYDIDLEQAFRDKEEINKKRQWKKSL